MSSSYNVFGLCSHTWATCAATLCLILAFTQQVQAKTFRCEEGDVACLIAAINQANANGHKNTIELEAGAYTLTAVDNVTNGPNGLPSITSTLTIKGAGADATSIRCLTCVSSPEGSLILRLMHVGASGNLTLEGVTLSGGHSGGFTESGRIESGGGLMNDGGAVHIVRSAITGNQSDDGGGGLTSEGTLTIRESRFSQNSAFGLQGNFGGGIALLSGTAFITKSTFDDNSARSSGAGAIELDNGMLVVVDSAFTQNTSPISIFSAGIATITNTTFARNGSNSFSTNVGIENSGTLSLNSVTFAENSHGGPAGSITLATVMGATTLQNTILARTTGFTHHDCFGPVTSLGHNLIEDPTGCNINLQLSDLVGDPGLDTFQDNGKPGNAHFPLLPSSRAIDTGAVPCPRRDQIGQRRINECDTGAIAFHDGIDALP